MSWFTEKSLKMLSAIGIVNAKRARQKIQSSRRKRKLDEYKNVDEWKFQYRGINLKFDTSDNYSKSWFFPRYDKGKIHEPVATDLFIDYVGNDSVVLDIGVHIGYFTCLAAYLAPDGSVHSFEVDPRCHNFIEKNAYKNNLNNVTINKFGVSNIEEIIKIPRLEEPNPGLIINSNNDEDGYVEVKSIIIDDYVHTKSIKPDFVKVDVEGAEWKVLRGMSKLLDKEEINLMVEIHVDQLRDYFDTDYHVIIDFLLEKNFEVRNIEQHRSENGSYQKIDRNSTLRGNTMLFCTKK